MRINEIDILIERAVTKIPVLGDFADAIISAIPKNIPVGFRSTFRFGDVAQKLEKKYETDPIVLKIIKNISSVPVTIINKSNGTLVAGEVVSSDHSIASIAFNVAALLAKEEDISKEDLLKYRGENAIKGFRAIVVHELRHVFQFFTYKDFYKKTTNHSYKTSPIEIDAAWMHNLEDHPTSEYKTAREYVKAVMSSLSGYKELTPKQIKHYSSKTASYWADNHLNKEDRLVPRNLNSQLMAKRQKIIDSVGDSMAVPKSSINLREIIPSYSTSAGNFLLAPQILSAARSIILSGKPNSNKKNASVVYLAAALLLDDQQFRNAVKVLSKLVGFTPEDMIENMSSFTNFDQGAIKNYLQDRLDVVSNKG